MNLSHKLDLMQKMARECAQEPHKAYLVGLLADHAQEEAFTEEFLQWIQRVFSYG